MKKTIVCIFAHPDDESFGPGGTIAKLAPKNDIYIVCATSGEAGIKYQISIRQMADKDQKLGEIRRGELLKSAEILGVKKVYFLGFKDGTLSNNLYHKLADAIKEKLELLKPQIVLTYEPRGISGHIDHITIVMVTMFVCQKLSFIKEIWQYFKLERYKKHRRKKFGDYFIYMPPGYKDKDADKIIDTSDVFETKVKAMQMHKSQIKDVERVLTLQKKFPKKEYFFVIKNRD